MEKFCIFCGGKPSNKNKEHIIPQWLIEMTGDKKRIANFGLDWKNKKPRQFSFDSFHFPACELCNAEYSKLEASAKKVITNLINDTYVNELQLNTLLDWLDKVRIGLWLGYFYLDKNICEIQPHFYINSRIGMHDRMVAIYKGDYAIQKIGFKGTGFPSFQFTPSCFTLNINEYYFFNISYDYLFAKKLGFPFPICRKHIVDGKIDYFFKPGTNIIELPILDEPILRPCIELYQPMFKAIQFIPELNEFYNNEYVKKNCLDYNKGIGKVFLYKSNIANSIKTYPQSNISFRLSNDTNYDVSFLNYKLALQTLKFQNYLTNIEIGDDNLDEEQKEFIKTKLKMTNNINETLISQITNENKQSLIY